MLTAAHQEVLSPTLTARAASTPSVSAPRLLSLDVMRGITIAAMILVTDPGTYSAVFPPLLHAAWQGATPTDMIFPAFLFMVGVSAVFSIQGRLRRGATRGRLVAHVLLRFVVLIALGLLVNGFPFYDLHHLRIPGILQRIALCYATCALLYLAMSRPAGEGPALGGAQSRSTRTAAELAAVIAVILIGYWVLLQYFAIPGDRRAHV